MARRYSPEVHAFIAQNVLGTTTRDLVAMVNEKFNLGFTEPMMKSYKTYHKLKSGTRCGTEPGFSKVYPKEVQEFIAREVSGRSTEELTDLVNERFGTNYEKAQLRAYKKNHKLSSGLDCRFRPGHVPQNKGMKGVCAPGCEKTWFKKGSTPVNHRPVGSERVDVDGYILVKVAEPNKWRMKHRIVWEEHHGKIPDGQNVIFLDGNKLNTEIENLALVTNSEHLQMNRDRLRSEEPECTKSGILVARLSVATHRRKKQIRERGSENG